MYFSPPKVTDLVILPMDSLRTLDPRFRTLRYTFLVAIIWRELAGSVERRQFMFFPVSHLSYTCNPKENNQILMKKKGNKRKTKGT